MHETETAFEIPENNGGETRATGELGTFARLAGLLGGITIVMVAIQTVSAWYFGRGFLEAVGFPPELINLRTSTDYFPALTMEASFLFLVSLCLGILGADGTAATLKKRAMIIGQSVFWGFGIAGLGRASGFTSPYYAALLGVMAFLSPALIGFAYNTPWESKKEGYFAAALVLFEVFFVGTSFMFVSGRRTGLDLIEHSQSAEAPYEHGVAAWKNSDYPLIGIRSKEKLLLKSAPLADGDAFNYTSTESDFLRLILQDEANYYVVESVGGRAFPYAIRKELVEQVSFAASTGTSNPFPFLWHSLKNPFSKR